MQGITKTFLFCPPPRILISFSTACLMVVVADILGEKAIGRKSAYGGLLNCGWNKGKRKGEWTLERLLWVQRVHSHDTRRNDFPFRAAYSLLSPKTETGGNGSPSISHSRYPPLTEMKLRKWKEENLLQSKLRKYISFSISHFSSLDWDICLRASPIHSRPFFPPSFRIFWSSLISITVITNPRKPSAKDLHSILHGWQYLLPFSHQFLKINHGMAGSESLMKSTFKGFDSLLFWVSSLATSAVWFGLGTKSNKWIPFPIQISFAQR